jgi:hypothetical protein
MKVLLYFILSAKFDIVYLAPIVNGYFVVATESMLHLCIVQSVPLTLLPVFDDSGCPHTLEQYAIFQDDVFG